MATLTYCGHSAVIIDTGDRATGKRKVIAIDPFLDGNPNCPDSLKTLPKLDLICLTHGHSDHAGQAASLAQSLGSTICATWELANLMNREGVPVSQLQFMNKGGKVSIDGISVHLTQAFHSNSYDASDGKTHYAGEAAGVVIQFDGISIYHAGDTLLFGDMKLIGDKFKPDVAFLPIGDRFTMDPIDAAAAVELIKPRVAIPIHYDTFPLLTGTSSEFVIAAKDSSSKIVVLRPGESFSV